MNGILKNETLLGDPFYTSRMKSYNLFSLQLDTIYVPNNSIFNGNTEILSLGEVILSKLKLLLDLNISNLYIISSITIGLFILIIFQKILIEFQINSKKSLIFTIISIFIFWGPFFPYNLQRPVSPQIILTLWLTFIALSIKSIKNKLFKYYFTVGIVSGISIYFHYPYLFLQIQAGMLLFILLMAMSKEYIKGFIGSIILSWVIASPYLIWSYNARKFEENQDLLLRLGLIQSHVPSAINTTVFGIVAVTLNILISKINNNSMSAEKKLLTKFLLAQILSCIFIANSNVITGFNLQFSDHFDVFMKPLLILNTAIFLKILFNLNLVKMTNPRKSISYLSLGIFLFSSIAYASGTSQVPTEVKNHIEDIEWFKIDSFNTSPILIDNLALADSASALLPNKLFTNNNIFNYNFSQKEINQRYFASAGCLSSTITDIEYEKLYGFRIITEIRKTERVFNLLNKLNVARNQQKLLAKKNEKLRRDLMIIKNGILLDYEEVEKYGCINFIKDRQIKTIVSSSPNNWAPYIDAKLLSFDKSNGRQFIYTVN
jgi:hypothetical protein